jgi:PAS domain S-box-containing protein
MNPFRQRHFSEDNNHDYHAIRFRYKVLAAVALIAVLCLGWSVSRYLVNSARNKLQNESNGRAGALSSHLLDRLEETEHSVMVMAGTPLVAPALQTGGSEDIRRANLILDRYREALDATVCYLVDVRGVTIASSNRDAPDSYIGKYYGFRPYFTQPLLGQPGGYFALGVTSGERGYYASYPVRDGYQNIIGVAVIKRKIESVESTFRQYPYCFCVDPHGIVFFSSQPDLLFTSLWPLDDAAQQVLIDSRQFGSGPFKTLGLPEAADGAELLLEGQHFYVTRKFINPEGWSVVLFTPTHEINAAWLLGIFITLSLSVLTILFFLGMHRFAEYTARISASEENYRAIFNGVNEGIFVHEFPGGRIVDVNQKTCEMYGFSREEILKQGAELICLPPYTVEKANLLIEKAATGETQLFDWLAKDTAGNLFWVEVNLKKVSLGGKECILAVVRDITGRKQAKEALKESEDNYRTIFETTGASTFIIEENTTISLVNKEFETLSGYTKEELEGKKSWTEFVTGEDLEIMKEYHHLRRIDPGSAPGNYEFRFIDRHGHIKNIFLTVSMIPGQKKSVASMVDITERKRMEQALKEKTLFQQRLIDTIPNPIIYKNIHGLYQGCNKAFEAYTGLTKEAIIGKTVYDIYPKDPAEKYEEMDLALFCEPGVQNFEYYFLRADGTRRDVIFNKAVYSNTDGSVAGLIGVMVDITERKKVEEALRLSEERFFTIFNASPSIISITTFKEGRFINVNESFLQVLGYNREDIIGRTASDINIWISPERSEIIKMLRENKNVNNLECIFSTKTGGVITGLYSAELVCFNGEQHLLSSVNDITERKRLEEEMARLERLNLIGEMAAGIGHEIRNPMTTVRGFLQLLGDKKECAQFKEYYALMIGELDRANSIITEFLSLAKKKTLSRKAQNLSPIVGALLPLIQADATRAEKYVKATLGDTPDLLLDEKEIRQLILNLIRNGLEAMSPGGYINIRTYLNGENVVLAIDDQGKGIEPEVLEKIGTPFFTTKDSGTGLGLAVCYSIAARHEATIEVETSPRGTTFYIKFELPKNTAVA